MSGDPLGAAEQAVERMALEGQKPDDASIERIIRTVTRELLEKEEDLDGPGT